MATQQLLLKLSSSNKPTQSSVNDWKGSSSALERVIAGHGVKSQKLVPILRSSSQDAVNEMAQSILDNGDVNDPFYVLDLGVVVDLWQKWQEALPTVRLFYAVKCNPEPALLSALATLGSGFDCASQSEIEAILKLGVSPDRIVYANPCKAEIQLQYAANVGVNLTTFDSIEEVEKIKKVHPRCALLLRVKVPDEDEGGARFPLGSKYGALPEEVEPLLQAAERSGLPVLGVAFHVGSAVSRSCVYAGAVAAVRGVFDSASRLGLPKFGILNIGGGFIAGEQFAEAAGTVRTALQTYFPNETAISVMGEPGRYFAETAFSLVCSVIGKRVRGEVREYWINDGVFGSLNCLLQGGKAELTALPLAWKSFRGNTSCTGLPKYRSIVFGQTCAAMDTVLTDYLLPELGVDDWLVFPNMGAYTAVIGSNFNGFSISAIRTYCVAPPSHPSKMIYI